MSPSGRQGSAEQPCHTAAEGMPRAERKEALLPFAGLFRQKHPREQRAILLFPQGRVPGSLVYRYQAAQAPLCVEQGGSLQNKQLNMAM